jgi:hypothetical protein
MCCLSSPRLSDSPTAKRHWQSWNIFGFCAIIKIIVIFPAVGFNENMPVSSIKSNKSCATRGKRRSHAVGNMAYPNAVIQWFL